MAAKPERVNCRAMASAGPLALSNLCVHAVGKTWVKDLQSAGQQGVGWPRSACVFACFLLI